MTLDRALGQPIRPLLKVGVRLFPFAFLGLIGARFLPQEYYDFVWVTSFTVLAACIALFTPYLMLAVGCFYLMSRLSFPETTAIDAWYLHALLLIAVACCFWRTWILWPANLKRSKPLPTGAAPAPWWGYLLGALAISGLFLAMAYFLHFQD